MAEITKPVDINKIWASAGDVLAPSDSKIATGWQVEIPARQYFNYIDWKQDAAIAHINQHGIPVWDNTTEYQYSLSGTKSICMGSDGTIYRAKQVSINQNPVTDTTDTYWEIAFANVADFYTQTQSDARYLQKAANLSDLTNTATARTNLSVYSQAQTYTKTEVDAKTTVASTAQAQALTTNTTLITPLSLFESFKGSNQLVSGSSGYQKMFGNFVIQWCTGVGVVANAIGSTVIISASFPLPFTSLLNLQLTHDIPSDAEAGEMAYSIIAKSSSSASCKFTRISGSNSSGTEQVTASFLAIGYI